MALPVDAIGITKDNCTGEAVVSISVSMGKIHQHFEVIRVTVPEGGGLLSHWTTALGMRGKIHREADGCDMTVFSDLRGRLITSQCKKANHV